MSKRRIQQHGGQQEEVGEEETAYYNRDEEGNHQEIRGRSDPHPVGSSLPQTTDLEDLVEEHKKELTTQELQEMHQEEHEERQRVLGSDEDEEEKEKLDQAGLKALFAAWNTVKETLYKHHPDFARTQELMNQIDDECMTFFWETQKRRLKQSTMDKFFTKVIRKASQDNPEYESPAKKSKIEAEGEAAEGDQADSDDPDDPSISSTTMSGGDF